ncbi:MAG: LacI family DNA-binding transcriptional regulator [Acetanaerobacterium sp.]
MVTIKEVAKAANVSLATVSRVINNADNVAPKMRERVLAAIKELGYFPNNIARALVNRRAGSIAILLRNLHSPFYFDLIRGFEAGSAETEYSVIFCSSGQKPDERERYLQYLTNGVTDGIIIYGSFFSDQPLVEHLHEINFPFLLIENDIHNIEVNSLLINNFDGARRAVEYLIENGHSKIAYLCFDPNKKAHIDRLNGYTSTMQRYGLPIRASYIQHLYLDDDHVSAAVEKLLGLPDEERPTAIFCSNDEMAAVAIESAMQLGARVPDDVSVVGFDNQSILPKPYHGPAITSVSQPFYEMGRDSVRMLLNILENKDVPPIHKIYDTQLVIRDTVRNITPGIIRPQ